MDNALNEASTQFASKKLGSLASRSFAVPESWIFAHPTRLTSAWEPRMLEILRRGYELSRPAIDVSVEHGSTASLGIGVPNRLRRAFRNLASPINYSERPFLDSRYETDGNIAHLLTLVLPRLLAFQKFAGEGTVVLRQNASAMGRAFFDTLNIPYLCTDRHVIGDLIKTGDVVQGAFEGWYPDLFRDLQFADRLDDTSDRVLLCRRGRRRILNEDSLVAALNPLGFKVVYFEDISIGQQWSWIRNARTLVAVHGAGMAALVFARPGIKVVELFHPGFVNDIYRNMIAAYEGLWCGVTGRITEDTIRKLDYGGNPHAVAMDSFEIDISTLRSALDFLGVN